MLLKYVVMKKEGLTFDHLLQELKTNNKETVKGNYTFKELTLKQQRKILNASFDAVEVPAKLANIYSEYISDSIFDNNDIIDMSSEVTLETKPFFINELRSISLGRTYYEKGEGYELYEVTPEDLIPKAQPKTIIANKFKINIAVPNLQEDSRYNSLLINALAPYKKKRNIKDINVGSVTDLYQVYELLKYIVSFEFNGDVYIFNRYSIQDRIKFINNLAQVTINEIKEYVKEYVKASEERAMKATSLTTGDSITADINSLFFSATTNKKESKDNNNEQEEDEGDF